jgi:hypothetical protein
MFKRGEVCSLPVRDWKLVGATRRVAPTSVCSLPVRD